MKYIFLLVAVAMLSACNIVAEPGSNASAIKYVTDQKLRAERFDACMKALPAGPVSTQYNDWSEVVDSCETAAYRQSQKFAHQVNGQWVFEDGKPVQ